MTIDSYAHCGLDKYLPAEALEAVMAASGVTGAVLCQHLGQFDNSYIASLVHDRPQRFAGVALVDHRDRAVENELESLIGQRFRGVRITSAALAEYPPLAASAASAGLIPLIYAPDGIAPLVPAVLELAAAHRRTPVVVSHLGNPRVVDERLANGEAVISLAAEPNVYVNLSGLGMFCAFPYGPLDGLVHDVLTAFGPERVMWGSNFPVCGEGASDYRRDLDLLGRDGRWGIDAEAAALITDATARRVWFDA